MPTSIANKSVENIKYASLFNKYSQLTCAKHNGKIILNQQEKIYVFTLNINKPHFSSGHHHSFHIRSPVTFNHIFFSSSPPIWSPRTRWYPATSLSSSTSFSIFLSHIAFFFGTNLLISALYTSHRQLSSFRLSFSSHL